MLLLPLISFPRARRVGFLVTVGLNAAADASSRQERAIGNLIAFQLGGFLPARCAAQSYGELDFEVGCWLLVGGGGGWIVDWWMVGGRMSDAADATYLSTSL